MNNDWFGQNIFGWDRFGTNYEDTEMNKEAKAAYEYASGVDISKQREIWDERAKGYWGEYKVFTMLYKELDFPNKILVNVQIPTDSGRSTEIDLLLFAPTGIYVFEVKHYSGKVYGGYDSSTWTEYYKARDSVTFENPLKQNEYHMSQLRNMFPNINLYSYVVFTNANATIRVGGRYPGNLTVCDVDSLAEKVRADFAGREEIYSSNQIETFFKKCKPYSPMETNKNEFFQKGEEILPFSDFASAILQDVECEKQKARESVAAEVMRQTEALRKEQEETLELKNTYIDTVKRALQERDKAVDSLEEFSRNFVTVSPFFYKNKLLNRDCFKAEVNFENSTSFVNTVNMRFSMGNQSSELRMDTTNAWFIVGLKNGTVQKYVLGEHIFRYSRICSGNPHSAMIRLFNVSIEEIRFIKLCNVCVTEPPHGRENVAPGVEFEMYVSDGAESVYASENVENASNINNGVFELSRNFLKRNVSVGNCTDGEGCDISFSFEAGTEEVGFDLRQAVFVIGTKNSAIVEYELRNKVKHFYSTSVLPKSCSDSYVMHLVGVKEDEILFIRLKNLRVFRSEYWQTDDIMPNAEFDIFPIPDKE